MELQNGVLQLIFDQPAPAKFVVSPNAPVRQVWVSALSRSYKLSWAGDVSTFTLDGERLSALLERLASGHSKARMPRSLILSPTRELATQTAAYFEAYGKHLNLSMALLIGGVGMDEQWRRLTETSVRRTPEGKVTPHYDPKMVLQFTHHPQDYDQWDAWDAIDVPTLCLRGESSDLLLPEVAEAMRTRGPRAVVVTIPGCGHAPALNVAEQLALVERFLAGR